MYIWEVYEVDPESRAIGLEDITDRLNSTLDTLWAEHDRLAVAEIELRDRNKTIGMYQAQYKELFDESAKLRTQLAEAERKVRAAFPVLRRVSEYSTDPVASADAKTALREIGEE